MDNKRVEFLGSSYRDLVAMPEAVVDQFGYDLGLVQNDLTPEGATPLSKTFENGVWELRDSHAGDAYRAI